jgi:DNA polymerase-4
MHEVAWGRDDRPVVTSSEPVSMSRETTFDKDLHAVRDKAALAAIFTSLCEKLAEDLQRKGYAAKTIGIKLRYDDFKIATRDQTLSVYTSDAATIRHTAGQCLKRVPLNQKLRLLGVRAGTLEKTENLLKLTENSSFLMPNEAVDQLNHAQSATENIANIRSNNRSNNRSNQQLF